MEALLFPLLSSIKPIGHYAMLGCPARGPGPGPAKGRLSIICHNEKKQGKKCESESVLWGTCWRCLQLPADYADYSHRRRRRVLSIPLHNLHRSRQILIAHANHKLNLQSASHCAALRLCSSLSPPCHNLSLSFSIFLPLCLSFPLSLSTSLCVRVST